MCTFSWAQPEGGKTGYDFWFNRDEKKDRPVAELPEVRELGGVQFIAPRDPQGGGTWIFANEYGVTAALLNRYQDDAGVSEQPKDPLSRGQLMLDLADSRSTAALWARAEAEGDYNRCPPFEIVSIGAGGVGMRMRWDGVGSTLRRIPLGRDAPLTSSSFEFEAVRDSRFGLFADTCGTEPPTSAGCREFHHSTRDGELDAFGVLMNRPDAQTWSVSRVSVDGDGVTFAYEHFPLDHAGEPEHHEVTLAIRK